MVNQFLNYLKTIAIILLFVVVFASILGIIGIKFNLDYSFLIKILLLLSLIWLVPLIKLLLFSPKASQKAFRKSKKKFFDQLTVIQRRINPFLAKRWVKWGLIPVLLFFLGLGMSFVSLFGAEEAFSVLIQNYGQSNLIDWRAGELLAGEKVAGEFEAEEDYLGIVSIRFNTFERMNDDILIFRLKEKGCDWYYENEYKTDQFLDDELFPFGFRKIDYSRGKTYQFEIESTLGEEGNAVAIGSSPPVFRVKYKFERADLLANKTELIRHAFKKSLNMLHNYVFLLSSLVFFIPFFFYLFYLLKEKPLFNFEMVNNFFLVVILTFLAVLWVSFMEEFLTNFFGVVIEADNYWNLPTNFLVFWIVISVVVSFLKSKKL